LWILALQIDTQRKILVGILAVLAIACSWILEETKVFRRASGYAQKKQAADLAAQAFERLRHHYVDELGREIRLSSDPAGSGLIGPEPSPIRNARGNAAAKRTSINPNFAAVIVDYFRQIGLEPGDQVAIALSGSFPAMNVNLYAALHAMELRPTVITAVGASTYGATDPEFTWLDMERVLDEAGLIHFRSAAASAGGSDDMGTSLSPQGRQLLRAALERNGVAPLISNNILDSIAKRMDIYMESAEDIKAYVNVGGGIASLGSSLREVPIPSGLYFDLWKENFPRAGTMVRLARMGVPVVHLGTPQPIARAYGLPVAPDYMPLVGDGEALGKEGYSLTVTAVLLIVYLVLTFALALPQLRRRWLARPSQPESATAP
jgi:poly-gamma-glutamate system protein